MASKINRSNGHNIDQICGSNATNEIFRPVADDSKISQTANSTISNQSFQGVLLRNTLLDGSGTLENVSHIKISLESAPQDISKLSSKVFLTFLQLFRNDLKQRIQIAKDKYIPKLKEAFSNLDISAIKDLENQLNEELGNYSSLVLNDPGPELPKISNEALSKVAERIRGAKEKYIPQIVEALSNGNGIEFLSLKKKLTQEIGNDHAEVVLVSLEAELGKIVKNDSWISKVTDSKIAKRNTLLGITLQSLTNAYINCILGKSNHRYKHWKKKDELIQHISDYLVSNRFAELNKIELRSRVIGAILRSKNPDDDWFQNDVDNLVMAGSVYFLSHSANVFSYEGYDKDRAAYLKWLKSDKTNVHLVIHLNNTPKGSELPDDAETFFSKDMAHNQDTKKSIQTYLASCSDSALKARLLEKFK